LPEGCGRQIGGALEYFVEIGNIIKTTAIAHIVDGFSWILQ
jgi:hypothetical protein